ncbi:MAG: hypothetical protein OXG37_10510 [Actinomycetia bacterium]|nr:hypothetical protein [Actinomycetes bacterium]
MLQGTPVADQWLSVRKRIGHAKLLSQQINNRSDALERDALLTVCAQ